ncbi:SMI1/KNR4 family protein [Paenibacillaceae bacterium]|nr:SMI1/KNR4 family protein [Paenibacillaceae bacterium]
MTRWIDEITFSLRESLPELAASLYPPAGEAEIAATEQEMGVKFPDALRELYKLHNGQHDDGPGLFFGLQFLSLEGMLAQWKVWEELADDFAEEGDHYAVPAEAIKEAYINVKWLPLSHDGGGNHLGMDLDPGTAGVAGQVINFGRDEATKYVIAITLTDLLQFIAETVKDGHYTVSRETEEDGEDVFWSYGDKAVHFLDVLKRLALPVIHPVQSAMSEVEAEEWLNSLDEAWQARIRESGGSAADFMKRKTILFTQGDLSDLRPLARCTEVRELILSRNQIVDLEPLRHCVQLKKLYLARNPVSDLSALQQLPKLQEINLVETSVRNFTPLAAVKSLRSLTLSNIDAEVLRSLSNLTQVTELELSAFKPLSSDDWLLLGQLKNLKKLTLKGVQLEDMSFLLGCRKLKQLILEDAEVGDISALAALQSLKTLELASSDEIGRLEQLAKSESLLEFSGSYRQFATLNNLFNRKVDFSKIIGHMTDEEKTLWRNSLLGD